MKLDSFYGKAVTVLIALSAFIIPASNTTPEAENAYEQAAYQELLAAMPSAAPSHPRTSGLLRGSRKRIICMPAAIYKSRYTMEIITPH